MKKVYKYATGQEIPEGAIYLKTIVQDKENAIGGVKSCWYIWHYFLVEVNENQSPQATPLK